MFHECFKYVSDELQLVQLLSPDKGLVSTTLMLGICIERKSKEVDVLSALPSPSYSLSYTAG
jgi:hypothetical protein